MILNLGGRADYFDFNKDWNLSPRLSASYRIASETTLRIDVSNLFNFKNVEAFSYHFASNGVPIVRAEELWPIVPTLGMTIKY